MTMPVLGLADRGGELALTEGDQFEVHLPENASTGFQWSVRGLPDGVELVDEGPLDPAVGNPGAAGGHRFEFVARGEPSGLLTLELRRSWEEAADAEDGFEVRLTPALQ